MRDESKLMLGDAYLINGNVWDAQLTYSQVDKAFKEDPLGQEAKFRNARLSYFRSDFEWAKDQLEVLKTATTQLISNNAIELSLRIQDHSEMDTSYDALTEFASAELLLFQQNYDACLTELNRLSFKYTNHTLSDDIAFLKGEVYLQTGDYTEALEAFKRVYTNYSYEILADNALYESAMLQLKHFKNPEEAKALFEKIILDYPDSLFVVESRKQYERLKAGSQP
jgi:TolA-binding protein